MIAPHFPRMEAEASIDTNGSIISVSVEGGERHCNVECTATTSQEETLKSSHIKVQYSTKGDFDSSAWTTNVNGAEKHGNDDLMSNNKDSEQKKVNIQSNLVTSNNSISTYSDCFIIPKLHNYDAVIACRSFDSRTDFLVPKNDPTQMHIDENTSNLKSTIFNKQPMPVGTYNSTDTMNDMMINNQTNYDYLKELSNNIDDRAIKFKKISDFSTTKGGLNETTKDGHGTTTSPQVVGSVNNNCHSIKHQTLHYYDAVLACRSFDSPALLSTEELKDIYVTERNSNFTCGKTVANTVPSTVWTNGSDNTIKDGIISEKKDDDEIIMESLRQIDSQFEEIAVAGMIVNGVSKGDHSTSKNGELTRPTTLHAGIIDCDNQGTVNLHDYDAVLACRSSDSSDVAHTSDMAMNATCPIFEQSEPIAVLTDTANRTINNNGTISEQTDYDCQRHSSRSIHSISKLNKALKTGMANFSSDDVKKGDMGSIQNEVTVPRVLDTTNYDFFCDISNDVCDYDPVLACRSFDSPALVSLTDFGDDVDTKKETAAFKSKVFVDNGVPIVIWTNKSNVTTDGDDETLNTRIDYHDQTKSSLSIKSTIKVATTKSSINIFPIDYVKKGDYDGTSNNFDVKGPRVNATDTGEVLNVVETFIPYSCMEKRGSASSEREDVNKIIPTADNSDNVLKKIYSQEDRTHSCTDSDISTMFTNDIESHDSIAGFYPAGGLEWTISDDSSQVKLDYLTENRSTESFRIPNDVGDPVIVVEEAVVEESVEKNNLQDVEILYYLTKVEVLHESHKYIL